MTINDIPISERDSMYKALATWYYSSARADYIRQSKTINVLSVSTAPVTLKSEQPVNVPVTIRSSKANIELDIYVVTEFNTSFLAEAVLPLYPIGIGAILGNVKRVLMSSTQQTFHVEIVSPRAVITPHTIPFHIFVNENISSIPRARDLNAVSDASSYYVVNENSFDAPVFEAFGQTVLEYGYNEGAVRDRFGFVVEPGGSKVKLLISPFRVYNGLYTGNFICGVCYSQSPSPTIEDKIVYAYVPHVFFFRRRTLTSFKGQAPPEVNIYNLQPDTTYYFRPFATNSKMTYGDEFQITTPPKPI